MKSLKIAANLEKTDNFSESFTWHIDLKKFKLKGR